MDKISILLVADGRSPITRNWIKMLQKIDCEIHLASTYPYEAISDIAGQRMIPVGFSSYAGGQVNARSRDKKSLRKQIISLIRPFLMRLRAILTPLLLPASQKELLQYVNEVQPDIVHALRIPFEGMLASALPENIPLVVSIWGNDLTLHAKSSSQMHKRTKETLMRADALMADAARDIEMAKGMGLGADVPVSLVPGSGGLDLPAIKWHMKNADAVMMKYGLPEGQPLVINPRGFRPGSVHQDVFFSTIPLVLEKIPDAHFICPGMQGQPVAEKWIRQLGISEQVTLLPFIPQAELWGLYAQSDLYVSLSSHDGTPNSFLEAIACGCYPVVGDILSLREWISHGENGALVNPRDARVAAKAISNALENEDLRSKAAKHNYKRVKKRADRMTVSKSVKDLYKKLL